MRKPGPESPLSEGARQIRSLARFTGIFTGVLFLGILAAYKKWIPPELGSPLIGLFTASLLCTIWFGLKAHKKALEDREKVSGGAMIVAIAAQLGRQDDDALERIKSKGGPAGEAAAMILMGRAEKLKRVRSEE